MESRVPERYRAGGVPVLGNEAIRNEAPLDHRDEARTGHGDWPLRSVVLIARAPLTRNILALWLQELGPGFAVVPYEVPEEALRAHAVGDEPALAVVECDLSGASEAGAGVLQRLRGAMPATPLIVVSDTEDARAITLALRMGARGYIPTTLEISVAIAALRLVLCGGVFAPALSLLPQLVESSVARPPRYEGASRAGGAPAGRPEPFSDAGEVACHLGLTLREGEIFLLLRRGRSNRQIARELSLSGSTVIAHIRHLMRKLGASNRTEAVFRAQRLMEGR